MTHISEMTRDTKVNFLRAYYLNNGLGKHTKHFFYADILGGCMTRYVMRIYSIMTHISETTTDIKVNFSGHIT